MAPLSLIENKNSRKKIVFEIPWNSEKIVKKKKLGAWAWADDFMTSILYDLILVGAWANDFMTS